MRTFIARSIVTSTVAVAAFTGLGLVLSPAALADHHEMGGAKSSKAAKGDIIATATGPEMTEVSTLVKAIQAADLVETLKGKGPFTVFAPTNSAFAKLPEGTLETLLKPENKEQLRSILLYHVHAGAAIKAADVKTTSLKTAQGGELDIKAEGGNVTVNGAKVVKTDIVASNGVIHWIDGVVLPKSQD